MMLNNPQFPQYINVYLHTMCDDDSAAYEAKLEKFSNMSKSNYKYRCIVYEIGDKVKARHPESLSNNPVLEIEFVRSSIVGTFATQLLKFKGIEGDINISNHYEPAEDTIEKYANTLIYHDLIAVKQPVSKKANTGDSTKDVTTFKRPKSDPQ